jgi:GNAT superfamily N-acetyltransferase
MTRRADGYEISTDPARLDVELVHRFLITTEWWRPDTPRERLERAIERSRTFGLYAPDGGQAGFARVMGDDTTFAYLDDVFVLPEHRGRGLSVWLVETILTHPQLRDVGRVHLATTDAHGLYARFGFAPLDDAGIWMQRHGLPPHTAS